MKPVLVVLGDDAQDLKRLEAYLEQEIGTDFRIVTAGSGQNGLDSLKRLKREHAPVALLMVSQHLPDMEGVAFLEEGMKLFPDAKRVLHGDRVNQDAVIRAINAVGIDYYLLKPWEPPEQNLYPAIHDMLSDWRASARPADNGLRVIGHRWSAPSHELRTFLGLNDIPYRWLDLEQDAEAERLLAETGNGRPRIPLVLLPDGSFLEAPTPAQLAEKLGMKTHPTTPFFDLVIIGGGPAGLAAAIYGASEGLKTALIEREAPGGQAGTSTHIENYPGFPAGLTGQDLAWRAMEQASRFGVEMLCPAEVEGLEVSDGSRTVKLSDGSEVRARVVIITTGVAFRQLDAPGVQRLTGSGIFYGSAMVEALYCRGADVIIVGGANSAGQAAVYLADYARSITMLVREPSVDQTMSAYLIDEIGTKKNITIRTNAALAEAQGKDSLESVIVTDLKTGAKETLPAQALFIFIGAIPHTDWVPESIKRDSTGFILTGPDINDGQRPENWPLQRPPFLLETAMPAVFAAGDVRHGSIKRVASAVGDGAVAATFVHQCLKST